MERRNLSRVTIVERRRERKCEGEKEEEDARKGKKRKKESKERKTYAGIGGIMVTRGSQVSA